MYADQKRNATESDIFPGGTVLLRRKQTGKLDTPFIPEPFHVVQKTSGKATAESPEGAKYSRSTSHVKMFLARKEESSTNPSP